MKIELTSGLESPPYFEESYSYSSSSDESRSRRRKKKKKEVPLGKLRPQCPWLTLQAPGQEKEEGPGKEEEEEPSHCLPCRFRGLGFRRLGLLPRVQRLRHPTSRRAYTSLCTPCILYIQLRRRQADVISFDCSWLLNLAQIVSPGPLWTSAPCGQWSFGSGG